MADGMGHFVSDYAKNKVGDDPAALQLVMGYYCGSQLPIYDMLPSEFFLAMMAVGLALMPGSDALVAVGPTSPRQSRSA